MEAEVVNAQCLVEVEGVVNLGECQIERLGIRAIEGALCSTLTEGVDEFGLERVPVGNTEAQPFAHGLAGDHSFGVVVAEAKTLTERRCSDERDLVDVPEILRHGCLSEIQRSIAITFVT
ncbi:Uncharacterised protein [Chlamydia trachomatis]|nr:Uncharacterised protein [Chlamydia trachomatis]